MHLKQLKLAGFKSFVDPTVVHFPGQLVGVVGPNGCGKSNIIDAVRWVMGESSAKNLRGESMTDVIFNGSSTRKPLGQASVELIFDNSLGRLSGPFASYGEIAVKRIVTRDGTSSYYLNGGSCRRKDITDIFLGTGAGARSYSIIGQGTVARMIEAKPEELRAFLEEAAGVSKYKERRRETLQRIEHTRDNLSRVADIRDELDKQLQRLERQAKAAERYTLLKEQERICRAEIMALKWHDLTQQKEAKQVELHNLTLRQEQQQSLLTGTNKDKTLLNEQIHDANNQSEVIQAAFYQLGTEIARLEEVLQQQDREKKRLEQDRQQMHDDWQLANQQVNQDKQDLLVCQNNVQSLQTQVQKSKSDFKEQELQWQEMQQQKVQWDERWQEASNTNNSLKREVQVTALSVQHTEQKHNEILLRLEKIKLEQESISIVDLAKTQQILEEQKHKLKETQDYDELQLTQAHEAVNQLRLQVQETEKQLHQLQDEYHRLNSEHAALMAAQKAARQGLNLDKEGIKEWSEKPRLVDVLEVETKWQAVCDIILNDAMHAYVLEDFALLQPQWDACQRQGETVVTLRNRTSKKGLYPCLADKIKGLPPVTMYHLETIYTADDVATAMSWLPNLQDSESIVTADGIWLSKGWAKFIKPAEHDEPGYLVRQQKIADLALQVSNVQQKIESVRADRDHNHAQLQEHLNLMEQLRLNLKVSTEGFRENNSKQIANEQALLHAEKRVQSMGYECDELQIQLDENAENKVQISEKLLQLEQQYKESEQQQEQYSTEKQLWLESLSAHNKQVEALRTVMHQSELEYDRELTKTQQLKDRINRAEERLVSMQERLENIEQLYQKSIAPNAEHKEQLAQLLMQHAEVESQLTLSREQLARFRTQLEDLDRTTVGYDRELKSIQELLSETKMQEQALAVRASAIEESLDELELKAQVLLEQIPEGVTQNTREEGLITLCQKINALGSINLAAIEEFSVEQQRKNYLDDQYNDLNQALESLETAIEKMDKETLLRLETTFDEVNTSFKALFPRLFGGGKAQLELTCDNLLEAGIVVMAQPPGKRNSTIHLLSGGEKAMTAVALVFAIFQLNPSPFCMLDEVDAPLDDTNVERFCDLVKEMSQFIQFLFISHNKVTMELADYLIGVTMREPGVSRLVSVDVKQALTTE